MATINRDVARGFTTVGIYRGLPVEYSGPVSYVAGGDPFEDHDDGLPMVVEGILGGGGIAWSGSAVRLLYWDRLTKKILWYVPNTGAEVTGATDLSTFKALLFVIGK